MKPNWAELMQGGIKPKRAGDIDESFFILYRVNNYKIYVRLGYSEKYISG
jgi:hypothetical protein